MIQFTPLKIWKWHTVLFAIHTGNTDTEISVCFGVNLTTVQRIRKQLNKSNGNYEGTKACSVPTRCKDSDQNQTPSLHHGVQGNYQRCVSISLPTWPQTEDGDLHQVPTRKQCFPGSRGLLLEDPRSGNWILCYATLEGEPRLGCEKISASTSALKSGRVTPQIAILFIMYGTEHN